MLAVLPPELFLHILSYAPLSALASFLRTSKAFNAIINEHEEAVYRRAAYLHAFTEDETAPLEETIAKLHGDFWEDKPVQSWKLFCHRSYQLEKNWQGSMGTRSLAYVIRAAGDCVHRIKADEDHGICIVSHTQGGLCVTDLSSPGGSSQILWSLPPYHVRRHAHVEYENGFLIFDRLNGSKEVWRLKSMIPEDESLESPAASPDQNMHAVAAFVAARSPRTSSRGHFLPWALLHVPEPARAYHYVHPTLAIAAPETVFLFDVPTGARTQISIVLDEIRYVELNAAFVFVCGRECVRVYARQGGARVLDLPAATSCARVIDVRPRNTPHDEMFEEQVLERVSVRDWDPATLNDVEVEGKEAAAELQRVLAAHVTPDGRHLAVLCEHERLILVQDWERVIRGEKTLEKCTLVVRIRNGWASYLAIADNRVAVATTPGIFIFTLDVARHRLSPPRAPRRPLGPDAPFLNLTASAARPWVNEDEEDWDSDGNPMPSVTCLQLTDRRVLFTWDVNGRLMPQYSGPPERGRPTPSFTLSFSDSRPIDAAGGLDDSDDDEDAAGAVPGPAQMALVPWGPRAQVGCIDLTKIP